MMTKIIRYVVGFSGTLFFVWLFNMIRHGSLGQDRAMGAKQTPQSSARLRLKQCSSISSQSCC